MTEYKLYLTRMFILSIILLFIGSSILYTLLVNTDWYIHNVTNEFALAFVIVMTLLIVIVGCILLSASIVGYFKRK